MLHPLPRTAAILACAALLAACRDRSDQAATPPPAAPPAAGEVPSTGGSVYEVRITTGADRATTFRPAVVTARRGDVIRFVLAGGGDGSGVSFPGQANPPDVPLPSPSPLMRQPGQVYEIPVDLPAGAYTFSSLPPGPAAAVGRLVVADRP